MAEEQFQGEHPGLIPQTGDKGDWRLDLWRLNVN